MKARTRTWIYVVLAFLTSVVLAIGVTMLPPEGNLTEERPIRRGERESMVVAEPTVPPQQQDYGPCTPGDREHPVTWCDPFGPEGRRMYCDETGTARLAETCSFWCWEDVDLGRRTPYCLSAADVRRLIESGIIFINR